MNKDKLKNASLIVALVLLAGNMVQIHHIKNELAYLKSLCGSMSTQLHTGVSEVKYQMQYNQNDLENLMQKNNSIFSHTTVDVKPQGKTIVITMSAVPKEADNGEVLIAKVTANGRDYQQEADESNQAVLVIDMADFIKPAFLLKSYTGIRQEVLDEIYTGELFTYNIEGSWSRQPERKMLLYARISARETGFLFAEHDIDRAEFIIRDTGIAKTSGSGNSSTGGSGSRSRGGSGGGSGSVAVSGTYGPRGASPTIEIPRGAHTPAAYGASGTALNDGNTMKYTGDFTEYAARKDGIRYEIYFLLTTRDGTQYVTPDNPIATFSVSDGANSTGSGSGVLWPVK